MPRPLPPFAQRFWARVEKSAAVDCWRWTGAVDRDGYGRLRLGGAGTPHERAHRAAWRLHFGRVPEGLCVCHRCDHPWCVNPAHLFLATNEANTADKVAKGREARGETCGASKLTAAHVKAIRVARERGERPSTLATQHGVSYSTIWQIVRRKIWRHVA